MDERYELYKIGTIEKKNGKTCIKICDRYREGLLGMEGFSHIMVIYWFHKNDSPEQRSILRVHPRKDKRNPLTGVFATRSSVRPNLVAISIARILSVKENMIMIDDIDAVDGTPVIDIKPYIPHMNVATGDVRAPEWINPR